MTEFSEQLKRVLEVLKVFFLTIWGAIKPVFERIGKFFTTERFRKIWRSIERGKINLIGISFLIAMFTVLISAFVMANKTEGQSWSSILFYDATDWFMDFFKSMWDSDYPALYSEYSVIYPPLIYIPLNLVLHFIPGYQFMKPEEIRGSQIGIIFFFIVFSLIFIAFAALLYKERKGTPIEKVLFIIAAYTSTGMIAVVDRGNIIIYAVFFAAMFLAFYKSEKWWVREISYVSLAFSVCLKIYPVFLGILILRNKNFTGAIRCGIYWLIIFVLPFIYYGNMGTNIFWYFNSVFGFGLKPGVDQETGVVHQFMRALSDTVAEVTRPEEQPINGRESYTFAGSLQMLFAILYGNRATLEASTSLGTGLLVGCFISSFFQDKDWKSAVLLSIFSFTFTASTYTYSLAFMIYPCLMFLNEANFKNPLHWIYGALFVAILGLFASEGQYYPLHAYEPNKPNYFYYLNYANIVERIAILIFTFLLICEGVFHMILRVEDGIVWIIQRVQINRRRRNSIEQNPYGRGK